MKIVKVVHADSIKELNREREEFSLQTFDIENFITEQVENWRSREPIWKSHAKLLGLGIIGGVAMLAIKMTGNQAEGYIKTSCKKLFSTLQEAIAGAEVLPLDVAKQTYPRTQSLSVGTFALHPFDSKRLTRLEHYHTNLAMEKDDELVVLLGKMGAKTVRIVEVDMEKKSSSGKLGVEEVTTGVTGQFNVSQYTETGKELIVNFEGRDVETDPHLLNSSLWFSTDSKLSSILASRLFAPNKIASYTLKNTYTETFDFDFDLAVRYLVVKADLKAEYSSLSKKERLFHVEFSR